MWALIVWPFLIIACLFTSHANCEDPGQSKRMSWLILLNAILFCGEKRRFILFEYYYCCLFVFSVFADIKRDNSSNKCEWNWCSDIHYSKCLNEQMICSHILYYKIYPVQQALNSTTSGREFPVLMQLLKKYWSQRRTNFSLELMVWLFPWGKFGNFRIYWNLGILIILKISYIGV